MNFFFVAVSGLHVLGEGSGTVRFFGTRQVALDARHACIWVLPTPSVSAIPGKECPSLDVRLFSAWSVVDLRSSKDAVRFHTPPRTHIEAN
uniref:Uncharacterized protein n=1 Tax=Ixodes ricinus TaxID=34613 RepID=A0A6B0UAS8_IXORI